MRSIYGSILLTLTLALSCEAYPATDSKEFTTERLARLFAQYEKLKSYNSDFDVEEIEVPDFIKEVWNPRGITGEDLRDSIYDNEIENRRNVETSKEIAHDYVVDKRAPSMRPYKYHTCYFNPVTCYGK